MNGSRQAPDRDYDRRDRERGDRGDRGGDRDRPRRRSRSPAGRGPRSGYDQDSYSSSRGYREREREDRYSGRDSRDPRGGGGGRDWDRDRGSYGRRDRRDDGGGRRDFDDRRGGGRREQDPFPRQQSRRSATPPKKPKEPTPDLTDVVSVLARRRRLTQWDIKPQGYENITAEQAKLSGMFPLPGAPRQQQMDPSKLAALMSQPGDAAATTALNPTNSRQAKRMIVSNLGPTATDDKGRDPCLSANVSKDKSFALLEFRNAEDATLSLSLDGLELEESHANGSNGEDKGLDSGLQIKRPKDYVAPSRSEDTEVMEGQTSNVVPDTPNKLCVTRIPAFIEEEQVKELLDAFGPLKSFVLVKDTSSGASRGVAFAEYVNASEATTAALDGLNGMQLVDAKLKIFKACVGAVQVGAEMSVNAMSLLAGTESSDLEKGRVLCLHNMVTAEELYDNDEYEEICEDVREECAKYGPIVDMKIPRPSGGSRQSNGVGKIYLKYETPADAAKAHQSLGGRKFADRTVVVSYFGDEYFDVSAW